MNRPKLKVIFVPLLFSIILASYDFKQDAQKDLGSIQVKKGVTVSQLNNLKFGSKDTLVLRDYMEGLFGEADSVKYKKHDFLDEYQVKFYYPYLEIWYDDMIPSDMTLSFIKWKLLTVDFFVLNPQYATEEIAVSKDTERRRPTTIRGKIVGEQELPPSLIFNYYKGKVVEIALLTYNTK